MPSLGNKTLSHDLLLLWSLLSWLLRFKKVCTAIKNFNQNLILKKNLVYLWPKLKVVFVSSSSAFTDEQQIIIDVLEFPPVGETKIKYGN